MSKDTGDAEPALRWSHRFRMNHPRAAVGESACPSALAKYASSVIKTYNVGEAKPRPSSLLDEDVGKRPMGFVNGRLTRAFFEPLPDEELAEFGEGSARYACAASRAPRRHVR